MSLLTNKHLDQITEMSKNIEKAAKTILEQAATDQHRELAKAIVSDAQEIWKLILFGRH